MSAVNRSGRAWLCAASAFSLIGLIGAPAMAQESADGPEVYEAPYFATYNPVTAADMVAHVPGFELRDGDDRRGFGATAGNLLINGERPASKTAASELLKRIPASNVLRIEVLSGTDSNSDVRGQSELVNVVLRQAAGKEAPITYVLGIRHIEYSNRIGWVAQASRTIAISPKAEVSLDLQVPNLLGRGVYFDTTRDGNGDLISTRDQFGAPNNIGLQGSAALRWRPDAKDTVNLNLQLAPTWNETGIGYVQYDDNGDLSGTLSGNSAYKNNYSGEVGADWEHRFTPDFSVKLIGLYSLANVDQHDIYNSYTAPSTYGTRLQDRSTLNGERVGRVQFKWAVTPAHTLEFGGEGAFNYRDTALDIATGPTGGPYTPVALAVANARVEEVRGEAFVSDIWTATPRLTLETGLNVEVSRITQTGDQYQQRDFSYPKPRVTATYALRGSDTLRFSLIRDVAQLDFSEFSSAVDFVNTSSTLGNPNLVPEQAWKSRLEWETHFGQRGAFSIAGFHDWVQDVHDIVDIGGYDAYGNIGDGSRTGVEIRASTPLAFIGMPNAEIRFNGLYQKTEVTDPITGEKRSFSVGPERQNSPPSSATLNAGNKDWAYVIAFRQEMPALQSSWGFNIVQWADRAEYRRAEVYTYSRPTPKVDLWIETKKFDGVTVRLFVNNIFSPDEKRVRTFYAGDRSSGIVSQTETRVGLGGPEGSRVVGIQLSGQL